MKNKILCSALSAIVFMAAACQNAKSSQAKEEVKDTVKVAPSPQQDRNPDLLGIWRIEGDETENAAFVIKPDSIFYPEQGATYLLKTKKDSLFIYYTGWTYKASYKIDIIRRRVSVFGTLRQMLRKTPFIAESPSRDSANQTSLVRKKEKN